MVPCKPKLALPIYMYAGGYPYDTLEECKQSVDTVFEFCRRIEDGEIDQELFEVIMNKE